MGSKTTITTGEWSCLVSFARDQPTCKEGKQQKNSKLNIYVFAGYRTSDPLRSSRTLVHLATEAVNYLCFKLLQYIKVTGNAWGLSKHVAIQRIKLLMFKGQLQ